MQSGSNRKGVTNPVLREALARLERAQGERCAFPFWANWSNRTNWANWTNWTDWSNYGNWHNAWGNGGWHGHHWHY